MILGPIVWYDIRWETRDARPIDSVCAHVSITHTCLMIYIPIYIFVVWRLASIELRCNATMQLSIMIIIIIIIRQPLCPVVGRRPQHVVSKLPCLVLSSAISCRSSICPGRLSSAWLVSLVVFSCHMVSKR